MYISASQPEDVLVIRFDGPIIDQQDGLRLPNTETIIRKALPPQVELGTVTESIEAGAETLQSSSALLCAGNAITNFLLAGTLNQLWGMINNL